MRVPFADLRTQYETIRSDIDAAIAGVVAKTAFIGGEFVRDFERAFAEAVGVKHCIGVANGTDAIAIALKMRGVKPGDEVITAANSWISSAEAVSLIGATPVFADVDPVSLNMTAESLAARVTPKTRAVVPVHLAGQAANMTAIMAVCEQHGLWVVEDCAQAHLSRWEGKHVGGFGDAGTFSFYPGKNLGAYGDAGCIVTNDDDLARKCRLYANHGSLAKHAHEIEGTNSRLDGLQAAILSAKLPHLTHWTSARRRVAGWYTEGLSGLPELALPAVTAEAEHSYHLYVIRASDRDGLARHLEERGVATARHYPVPLPLLPPYVQPRNASENFPGALKLQGEILSLPMYPELSLEAVRYVSGCIREFYRAAS